MCTNTHTHTHKPHILAQQRPVIDQWHLRSATLHFLNWSYRDGEKQAQTKGGKQRSSQLKPDLISGSKAETRYTPSLVKGVGEVWDIEA